MKMRVQNKRRPSYNSKAAQPVHLLTAVLAMVIVFSLTQLRPLLSPASPTRLHKSVVSTKRLGRESQAMSPPVSASDVLSESFGDPALPENRKRVCLVTYEVAGPHINGGIGTAFTNLALVLSKEGHHVTLVSSSGQWVSQHSQKNWSEWVQHFAAAGVTLVSPSTSEGDPGEPYYGKVGSIRVAAQAYAVYLWLRDRQHDFDIIHFPESCGVAFFTVLAKHQKMYFRDTILAVQTHGPLFWTYLANSLYPDHEGYSEADFLERRSMELADVLISPSHYMLDWLKDNQWKRPDSTFIIQNLLSHGYEGAADTLEHMEVTEVVFFGRFEQRKGIFLFCDALEALLTEADSVFQRRAISITFMGRATEDRAGRKILDRIEGIRAKVAEASPKSSFQVINNFNTVQARTYLKAAKGRMVVVPSSVENLPYTVMESIYEGIPLIASDAGGTAELFDEASRENLFKPDKQALIMVLRRALQSGIKPSKAAVSNSRTIQAWDSWHRKIQPSKYAFPTEVKQKPFISVVVATYNRAKALTEAIRSLEQQSYPSDRFEVILVDDGTTDTDSIKAIEALRPIFEVHQWRMARTNGGFLPSARNAGAVEAKGDYILFMEDDSIAASNELATFENVMSQGGADVLVCGHFRMAGDTPEEGNTPTVMALTFPGQSWNANTMGDSNFMIRAGVFRKLDGFSTERLPSEDWEFLNKAWLGGYRVELLPQPLFWKRVNKVGGAVIDETPETVFKSEMRAFRPFMETFGPEFPGASLLALKGEKMEAFKQPTMTTIVSSTEDFRVYPGYKNLFAEAKRRGGDTDDGWQPMTRVIDEKQLAMEGMDYPRVERNAMHPGHNYMVSQVWRSYVEGDINVHVQAYYTGPAEEPNCDGTTLYLEVNDKMVGEKYELTSKDRNSEFTVRIQDLAVGSTVRIVVEPKDRPDFDYVVVKFDMVMR